MLYKEYIKVESDFISVFSSSSDRIYSERLKAFYPHESFKKVLTLTVNMPEKSSSLKERPIWISGSYGTGKTFASFVVKHILEDNLDEVEKYFIHHDINSLWQRSKTPMPLLISVPPSISIAGNFGRTFSPKKLFQI